MRSRILSALLGLVLGVGAMSGCSSDSGTPAVTAAPWAREVATGEEMWTVSKDGWTITAYDMGRDEAERDSSFVADASGKRLVTKGDPIVFVNVVATNTSGTTLFVGIDEPELWATPLDAAYTQGVTRVTPATDRQMADHSVWYHSRMPNAEDGVPFSVAPGESFAMGFVLPLALSQAGEWVFVPSLWVHETKETPIGDDLIFEQRSHTFS